MRFISQVDDFIYYYYYYQDKFLLLGDTSFGFRFMFSPTFMAIAYKASMVWFFFTLYRLLS